MGSRGEPPGRGLVPGAEPLSLASGPPEPRVQGMREPPAAHGGAFDAPMLDHRLEPPRSEPTRARHLSPDRNAAGEQDLGLLGFFLRRE